MSGEIYFAQAADRIKIGYSVNTEKRLRALSTGSSHPITLLGTMPGSFKLETAIHRQLRPYRLQGEWFQDCTSVRETIDVLLREGAEAIGFQYVPPKKTIRKKAAAPIPDFLSCFESPYTESVNRFHAVSDAYVSERVVAARDRERRLGMVPGTLINPIIGGYYSPARWLIAGKMIMHMHDHSEDIVRAVFDAALEGEELPESAVNGRFDALAISLRKSLKDLFADPDLSVTNLGSFEWEKSPEDLREARMVSTEFKLERAA